MLNSLFADISTVNQSIVINLISLVVCSFKEKLLNEIVETENCRRSCITYLLQAVTCIYSDA